MTHPRLPPTIPQCCISFSSRLASADAVVASLGSLFLHQPTLLTAPPAPGVGISAQPSPSDADIAVARANPRRPESIPSAAAGIPSPEAPPESLWTAAAMPAFAFPRSAQAPRAPDSSGLAARDAAVYLTSRASSPYTADATSLESREVVPGLIPTYLRRDGPGTGAVVGIVLGSVAGFLLLVWLLWTLTNNSRNAIAGEEEIVVRRPRRNSNSHRSRRGTRSEVREYSRSPRRSGGRSTVIVEERRPPRTRSVVMEERSRVPGDDVVEVIEEHEDYRERRARRGSGYR